MNFETANHDADVGPLPVGTSVIWLGCLVVGILGLSLPYPRPIAPAPQSAPVQAQLVHVELSEDSSPPPDIAPPSNDVSPAPAEPNQVTVPDASPLVALASPSAKIAFALPTEGATTSTVDAKQAVPVRSNATAPRRLMFGQGEGRQPAPEYPREAALAHQQGTVVVHFTVGEDGRVQTAQAISPSPFPLLNQAAVRAVRETWRFPAGPARTFEVAIQFELRQR